MCLWKEHNGTKLRLLSRCPQKRIYQLWEYARSPYERLSKIHKQCFMWLRSPVCCRCHWAHSGLSGLHSKMSIPAWVGTFGACLCSEAFFFTLWVWCVWWGDYRIKTRKGCNKENAHPVYLWPLTPKDMALINATLSLFFTAWRQRFTTAVRTEPLRSLAANWIMSWTFFRHFSSASWLRARFV